MDFLEGMAMQESIVLVAFLTLAFLIGFVAGRLSSLRKTNALKRERDGALLDQDASKNEVRSWQERFSVREADLKRQNIEIDRLNRQLREGETRYGQLNDELTTANTELGQTGNRFAALNEQITDFRAAATLHQREIRMAAAQVTSAEEEMTELRKRLGNIDENMLKQLREDVNSLRYVNTLLEQERDDLQRTLHETSHSLETLLQKKESEDVRRVYVVNSKKGKKEDHADEVLLSQKDALVQLKDLIENSLPYASAAQKDDLKRINGIGPFIEEKLNAVGIYTYEQVSLLDDDFIDILTAAIGFFSDRIKRGRWIEQARELWDEKEQEKLSLPHREHGDM
ncbi:MAG: hypothetical protein RI894_456 [Bacteroidota bacterium]|jgi:predicted flap endonuclease-1-like 5' DNA nuclease